MEFEIISRRKALARGLTRYFTGKPCKAGHVAERRTDNRLCVECERERGRRWRESNPEEAREQNRRWRAANLEKAREARRRSRAADPEKARERDRRRYAANLEAERERDRRWRAANPEKVRELRRRHAAKWAAKKAALQVSESENTVESS